MLVYVTLSRFLFYPPKRSKPLAGLLGTCAGASAMRRLAAILASCAAGQARGTRGTRGREWCEWCEWWVLLNQEKHEATIVKQPCYNRYNSCNLEAGNLGPSPPRKKDGLWLFRYFIERSLGSYRRSGSIFRRFFLSECGCSQSSWGKRGPGRS